MKTIFIDRDGVINKDPGGWTEYSYVTDWKDFHFLPGSLEALRKLAEAGIGAIVVSNQAGISKGYYTKEKLSEINAQMLSAIREAGGKIQAAYYCVHRNEDNCVCRKPKTGLIDKAAKEHGVDLKRSLIIGDGAVDICAGKKAGLKALLVLSGKSAASDVEAWEVKPDHIFKDLIEAVNWLIKNSKDGG
ncbi:D-glycero-alpha-D-manno-heptose-1,7-bisphosphate 7-phosphatase [Candidatus Omnitrophota bacterium]